MIDKKQDNTFKPLHSYFVMSTNQQQSSQTQSQPQTPQQIAQQPQPTIDQVIQQMRSAQSQAHSDTQYLSLSNFDKLVDQLRIFSAQINDRNMEVARLQALCTKNGIDTTPPVPEPLQLAANEAVVPPVTQQQEEPVAVVPTTSVENKCE